MPLPTTAAELLARARSAVGNRTRYRLGRGGRQPNRARPDQNGECDCSGFVAWALGFDRFIRNPFYARINGERGSDRGWFETTAAWRDTQEPVGILRRIDQPVPGAVIVYPDRNGSEGHIGIVGEVRNGRVHTVIHCSSSASRAGDAIAENEGRAFQNRADTLYAWYELLDQPGTSKEVDVSNAPVARVVRRPAATRNEREALALLYAPRDRQGNVLFRIYRDVGNNLVWQGRAHICADGCPQAYHPNDTGLDALRAGGRPRPGSGNDHCRWEWWGVATQPNGCPYGQTRNHPFPGYYVSTTALVDGSYPASNPARFVDADTVPYLVMPSGYASPARLGDLGYIVHRRTERHTAVIFAESGPSTETGELSMEAARRLGINPDPRRGGSERREFLYLTFTGTRTGRRWDVQEIDQVGTSLFAQWGGMARVRRTGDL